MCYLVSLVFTNLLQIVQAQSPRSLLSLRTSCSDSHPGTPDPWLPGSVSGGASPKLQRIQEHVRHISLCMTVPSRVSEERHQIAVGLRLPGRGLPSAPLAFIRQLASAAAHQCRAGQLQPSRACSVSNLFFISEGVKAIPKWIGGSAYCR